MQLARCMSAPSRQEVGVYLRTVYNLNIIKLYLIFTGGYIFLMLGVYCGMSTLRPGHLHDSTELL